MAGFENGCHHSLGNPKIIIIFFIVEKQVGRNNPYYIFNRMELGFLNEQ